MPNRYLITELVYRVSCEGVCEAKSPSAHALVRPHAAPRERERERETCRLKSSKFFQLQNFPTQTIINIPQTNAASIYTTIASFSLFLLILGLANPVPNPNPLNRNPRISSRYDERFSRFSPQTPPLPLRRRLSGGFEAPQAPPSPPSPPPPSPPPPQQQEAQ